MIKLVSANTKPRGPYQAVRDSRDRWVPGIWLRMGVLYARNPKNNYEPEPLLTPEGNPCRNLVEAKKAQAVLRGDPHDRTKTGLFTISEVIDKYMHRVYVLNPYSKNSLRSLENCMRHFDDYLGDMPAPHFTESDMYRWLEYRKEVSRIGNRSLNIDINFCRQMFAFAEKERLVPINPLARFKALKFKAKRKGLMKSEHLEKILEKAKETKWLPEFINFLRSTGARKNEGLYAKWEDVDWESGRIRFSDTKNGEDRYVDFNPLLKETLLKLREDSKGWDSPYIFPSTRRAVRAPKYVPKTHLAHRYYLVCKKLGLDYNIHDLRHLFISNCVMAGIDYLTIAEWVGHKDRGVLISTVYGHLNHLHKQEMARRLSNL